MGEHKLAGFKQRFDVELENFLLKNEKQVANLLKKLWDAGRQIDPAEAEGGVGYLNLHGRLR